MQEQATVETIPKRKKTRIPSETLEQRTTIKRYYELHAKIYDLTRWTFLFGRKRLLRNLPFPKTTPLRILEVGCGTGSNLRYLATHYPKAQLTGLDLSSEMLSKCREKLERYGDRVSLIEQAYGTHPDGELGEYDLILFSYCLSMVNPNWSELISQAGKDLKADGFVAVADFHSANLGWYKGFMARNHVRMDEHLVPSLCTFFENKALKFKNGYLGVWTYFNFLGQKR